MSLQVWMSFAIIGVCALLIGAVRLISPFIGRSKKEQRMMIACLIIIPIFSLFMSWVFTPFMLWLVN
jgi:hypothetical protein